MKKHCVLTQFDTFCEHIEDVNLIAQKCKWKRSFFRFVFLRKIGSIFQKQLDYLGQVLVFWVHFSTKLLILMIKLGIINGKKMKGSVAIKILSVDIRTFVDEEFHEFNNFIVCEINQRHS